MRRQKAPVKNTRENFEKFVEHWANDPLVTQEEYEAACKGTGLDRFKLMWRMTFQTAYHHPQGMGILTINAKNGTPPTNTDGSLNISQLPTVKEEYSCVYGFPAFPLRH
tara:strand:+ start:10231 stop:10557 length:327 start_codon:yes stop_codon:yes gene_type:complete